jgi:chromate reductase
MTEAIHVLGIAGSLREKSWNKGLLRAASGMLPDGMTLEAFDLAPIPLFNEDVEAQGYPEPVEQFCAKIKAADALLIATPEYIYSVPGVLKNAIDWASRHPDKVFYGKPAAVIGAGGRLGTARAQNHLRYIAVTLNLMLINKPELFIMRAWEKVDGEGNLVDDESLQTLRNVLVALGEYTRKLR